MLAELEDTVVHEKVLLSIGCQSSLSGVTSSVLLSNIDHASAQAMKRRALHRGKCRTLNIGFFLQATSFFNSINVGFQAIIRELLDAITDAGGF